MSDLRIDDYDSIAMAWNDYYKVVVCRHLPNMTDGEILIMRNAFYTGANIANMLKNRGISLTEELDGYWEAYDGD